MPVYRYLCRRCGREFERDMPISLRDKVDCPNPACSRSPRDLRIVIAAVPSRWGCDK